MEHRINVLFYARKSKKNREGLVPLYIRITVNGRRLDHSIQRHVEPAQWSAVAGRVKGGNDGARQINLYLDTLNTKVLRLEREMVMDGIAVNFANFREKWLGPTERPRMLLEIFQQHNDQMAALVKAGKDFSPATLDRYNTTRDHVRAFLQWKFGIADIDIKKLNFEFVHDLEFWLKTQRKCAHNMTMKYIANLKKIVNGCIRKGWLLKDPFQGFKMTKHEVVKVALTEQELTNIDAKTFATKRLNYVKDIFLFSCYTGLAYADVKKLKRSEIAPGIDGNYWIFTNRQKTETVSRIPLLPPAMIIIEKYKDFPGCCDSGNVLPVDQSENERVFEGDRRSLRNLQEFDFSYRPPHFCHYRHLE